MRGSKCIGEKRVLRGERDGMNWHWAHNSLNRMYKCGCFKAFRVPGGVCHPRGGIKRMGLSNKGAQPKKFYRAVKRARRA